MCETMLQRLINALGDAADRYGEPPDPDPEAQAAMPTDEYITSPTGQHWLTYRAIRSGHSGVDWLRLAQHATREARALHPDRDPMNTAGGILAGFLRYHFTPRPEVPGLDAIARSREGEPRWRPSDLGLREGELAACCPRDP